MIDQSPSDMATVEFQLVSEDKEFLGDIFNEPVITEARPIALGDGVTITGIRWEFFKSISAADVATILLTCAAGVPFSIAADLLKDWLFKHKGSIEVVTFERTEVRLDDDEHVRAIIVERITNRIES